MLKPRDLCQSSGTKTFLDAMHGGKVHLARFVLDALDRKIINARMEQGRTPLMFAARLPDGEMRAKFIRLLLDNGAEVNCQDEAGRTALSQACELGHLEAVKLLVQFNADPEILDREGNSPLMYAASGGHSTVLDFLLKSFRRLGLRVERTNECGLSALQLAASRGHGDCVQVLSGKPRGRPAQGVPDMPRSPGRRVAVWSPRPLSRQVIERFTHPFQLHRPGAPPGGGSPREKGHSRMRHSQKTSLDREGRSRKAQTKGRNSWLFTARSSSCSPSHGGEKGRRWTSMDSGEHQIIGDCATTKGSDPESMSLSVPPTEAQTLSQGSQNPGQAVPYRGTSQEWDAPSPRIVIQTRIISRSHETLLRAESWDDVRTREGPDPERCPTVSWGPTSSKPGPCINEDEEALVGNHGPSRGHQLLRRFTSPEFQGLPGGNLAPKSEDSTFLLPSIHQQVHKEPPPENVSRGPLVIPRSRRQPIAI